MMTMAMTVAMTTMAAIIQYLLYGSPIHVLSDLIITAT